MIILCHIYIASEASQIICYSQVGIAMGALIIAEGLCAIVIAIIVVLCWSCSKCNRRKSVKREFTVSANISYGDVLLGEELYTNDDKLYANDDKLYVNDEKLYEQLPSNGGEMPGPKESPATKPELPLHMPQQKKLQVKGDS